MCSFLATVKKVDLFLIQFLKKIFIFVNLEDEPLCVAQESQQSGFILNSNSLNDFQELKIYLNHTYYVHIQKS